LSNQETFEHLGRQFVGGAVRVEEAIPKLVARLVAKLADSGTAAASILCSASNVIVAISASSSSLLLSAALALVPCFLELFAVATSVTSARLRQGSSSSRSHLELVAFVNQYRRRRRPRQLRHIICSQRGGSHLQRRLDGIDASRIVALCDSGTEASNPVRTSWAIKMPARPQTRASRHCYTSCGTRQSEPQSETSPC
jgi:hypothetical protein